MTADWAANQHSANRNRQFPRQPGAATLWIVVRDGDTGATGSVTVPFSQIENSK